MLKWCVLTNKNKPVVVPEEVDGLTQCKRDQNNNNKYTYTPMDSPFRSEVDFIYGTPQAFSAIELNNLKQENKQYEVWIKSIKSILKNIQKDKLKTIHDYKVKWESSIKTTLQILDARNDSLLKENRKKDENIEFFKAQLKKIEQENRETINAIQNQLSLLKPQAVSETITNNTEESELFREAEESGYTTDSSEDTIKGYSSDSSIDTIMPDQSQESDFLKLKEKNFLYKESIDFLNKKISSNLTLRLVKPSKVLEALKTPSFKKVELKQKNREKEKTVQFLEDRLEKAEEENAKIHALYQECLEGAIYQFHLNNSEKTLNTLEEELDDVQKELKSIDGSLKELQEKTQLNLRSMHILE